MNGELVGRSKALALMLLALDVAIAWVWKSGWGPSWEWRDDLLVLAGLAIAWSAVGVVFRSRLGVAGGFLLILWGLVGPVTVVVAILLCNGLFAFAITLVPLFPVPLAICALVVWGAFLLCWYAAKRIITTLQPEPSLSRGGQA